MSADNSSNSNSVINLIRLNAQINNEKYEELDDCYPTIYDGVEGMKFIETVLDSSKNNSKWIQFNK